jgi:hypothetical protein
MNNFGKMDKWLGKVMTIRECLLSGYWMEEDYGENIGYGWCWDDDMISGLAEPGREPCTVELRFDGMITTATLKRGGRDVKTAEARCNPTDTYSRAEGARVTVERLFEKKRKEVKPKESEPKVGDKFVIVGRSRFHMFSIGETVRLICICEQGKRYENCRGRGQWVCDSDVKPYKENTK